MLENMKRKCITCKKKLGKVTGKRWVKWEKDGHKYAHSSKHLINSNTHKHPKRIAGKLQKLQKKCRKCLVECAQENHEMCSCIY